MSDIADLAKAIWEARTKGGVIPRAAAKALGSIDTAYRVQREIAALAAQPRTGWKVGATSIAAQKLLGVDSPATAPMFVNHCFKSPIEIAIFGGQDTSIESEFAFRIARDLPPQKTSYDRQEVLGAVGAVIPSIEIVGCRFEGGFDELGALLLVADMVANTEWVKGRERTDWRAMDLKSHPVRLYKNDTLVAEGIGANALGDSLAVLE